MTFFRVIFFPNEVFPNTFSQFLIYPIFLLLALLTLPNPAGLTIILGKFVLGKTSFYYFWEKLVCGKTPSSSDFN